MRWATGRIRACGRWWPASTGCTGTSPRSTRDHDPGGFEWLDHDDAENSVIAFLRRGTEPDDHIVCILNFTPAVHRGYRIPVPGVIAYRERLNSDDALYGGSGVGNGGSVRGRRDRTTICRALWCSTSRRLARSSSSRSGARIATDPRHGRRGRPPASSRAWSTSAFK